MDNPPYAAPSRPVSPHPFTTMLTCGWGLGSAVTFFQALLVRHDIRLSLAAIVPMIAVWASLDRKRWGRLALLGLSAVTLGLFLATVALVAAIADRMLPAAERTPEMIVRLALTQHAGNSGIVIGGVALAALTVIWFCRANVIAEFSRNKKSSLQVGQRVIAASLVGCWGLTLCYTPFAAQAPFRLLAGGPSVAAVARPRHGTTSSHNRMVNKRAPRSIDAASRQ